MRNDPESLRQWAWQATAGIKDDDTKMQMRNLATKMIEKGKWRGDISETWKRYFSVADLVQTGQLKDLFL